jgi:hypothetical protein
MHKRKDLETIIALILFQLVLFWFTSSTVLLIIAFLLGVVGLLLPAVSNAINIGWMKLAQLIGYVMNRVLLTAIFFLVLFPLALLARLFSKKPKPLKDGKTYFNERNHTYSSENLENVW